MLVTFDLSRTRGNRVVSAEVRCTECEVPEFHPLDPEAEYKVILSTYLVDGGDGYTMITNNTITHDFGRSKLIIPPSEKQNKIMNILFLRVIKMSSSLPHIMEEEIYFLPSWLNQHILMIATRPCAQLIKKVCCRLDSSPILM